MTILAILRKVYQIVMDGEIPESWRRSRVKLIPVIKTDKVKVDVYKWLQAATAVMTELSYNIMGSILKAVIQRIE